MSYKYILPPFALIGLLVAFFMVLYGMRSPPTPKIAFPPPFPPYQQYVAGAGIVEAASEEINIGAPFNEIVTDVFVTVGASVKKGAPLFQLDIRTLQAEYEETGEKREVALTNYEDKKTELSLYQSLEDQRAVSENEFNRAHYAAETALKQVRELEATMKVIASKIERSTIRAPIDGQVLKVNVHIGERTDIRAFDHKGLMVFGRTDPLHIRVEVDEEDAWHIETAAPAAAFVRGNSSMSTPLHFLYIEPFITPKTTLTGDNRERVDTRVLQIVYEVQRRDLPIYPGQLMDIYIKRSPTNERF
ncbi:MAG: HlyD family efflux transporter periplasmic adaptor subunit [Chlamydiota bacterium]